MPVTELETEALLAGNRQQEAATQQEAQAVEKISVLYKGVRLKKKSMPYSKEVSDTQKKVAAKALDTSQDSISMSKKLFDSAEPKVKAVRKAVAEVNAWFNSASYTLPWPDKGIRLVKKGAALLDNEHVVVEDTRREDGTWETKYRVMVEGKSRIRRVIIDRDEHKARVQTAFQRFKHELLQRILRVKQAARDLAADMPAIIERQRGKMRGTFNINDYAFDAETAYNVEVSFPSLMPDSELAEIDPETFAEERERFQREQLEAVRREKVRMAEQLIGWLDGLALALSRRELLDKEHEVIAKKEIAGGEIEITYRDADRKEQRVTLGPAAAARRLSVDDKPRKFNNGTASRLFVAVQEAKQRKEELGITSPELDTALDKVAKMVRNENAATLSESLRTDEDYRAKVEQRCVDIVSELFESSDLVPRRAILRRQMKHAALHEE